MVTRQRSRHVHHRDQQLLPRLQQLKADHPAWGYRRVWAYLKYREGLPVNKKRIYRLLQEHRLLAHQTRRLRATRTSYRPGDVTNAMKSSVVKGIAQGMTVVRSLQSRKCLPGVDFTRSRNFLILVTFKDLFLGTGQDFYECYAGPRLDSALQGDPRDAPIPLENVFIVSIDEFDYLIACVLSSHLSFGSILRPAQEKGANPETKRLRLVQYLQDSCGDVPTPPYLKQELEHRVSAIAIRLGQEELTGK